MHVSGFILPLAVLVIAHISRSQVQEETRPLSAIYEAALAKGGNLVIRFGGYEKSQTVSISHVSRFILTGSRHLIAISAFLSAYPKINVTWTVDLSKVCQPSLYRREYWTNESSSTTAQ